VAFGKKTDPNGDYIKKWLPKLAKYDKKFIYEPWKASLQQQREWGCVVGTDYPHRIVDHDVASKANMAKMQLAYAGGAGAGGATVGSAATGADGPDAEGGAVESVGGSTKKRASKQSSGKAGDITKFFKK
jgi:FAD binding domain of DNA photolyase